MAGPGNLAHSAGVTPASVHFGLDHIQDPFWSDNLENWGQLGLSDPAAIVDIDSDKPDFTNARYFKTSLIPSTGVDTGEDPHNSPAADERTPIRSDGTPWYIHDTVWQHIIEGN